MHSRQDWVELVAAIAFIGLGAAGAGFLGIV